MGKKVLFFYFFFIKKLTFFNFFSYFSKKKKVLFYPFNFVGVTNYCVTKKFSKSIFFSFFFGLFEESKIQEKYLFQIFETRKKKSLPCWDISGSLSRLDTKKCSKTQIFKLSNMIIKCIKIIFRIQRSILKSFLVFWGPISTKIPFWKKNFPKFAQFCPKMTKITYFSKFNCGLRPQNGRYSAEKFVKSSGLPQILTKIFFITQTQKLVKKFQNSYPPPPQKKKKKKKSTFRGGGGGGLKLF